MPACPNAFAATLQVGEAYKATGRCFSVAAGRISFCYGLKGEAPLPGCQLQLPRYAARQVPLLQEEMLATL